MSKNVSTNIQLLRAARDIKYFRGVFMRDQLPSKPWVNESGIVNLNTSLQLGSHWTCYVKRGNKVRFFDSFGLVEPCPEIVRYFKGSDITYNTLRHQSFDTQNCGQICIRFLRGELWNRDHRLT